MTLIDVILFLTLSVGIIYLYFWLFQQYRIDVFRQRIFGIRDEVFDYAASGKIAFDHPAYITLRNLMNGYIRFSHKISLLHVGIVLVLTKLFNRNCKLQSFEEIWTAAIQDLDDKAKHELSQFRMRAEMNLFYYLFLSSMLKKVVAIPALIVVSAKFLFSTKLTEDELKEFRLYAYEDATERSSVKHSIEYVNEDAYLVGSLQLA